MKIKVILFHLISIVLFTACNSNDDSLKLADIGEPVPLRIAASIHTQANGITRASETSWEANDKIGVYVTNHNSETLYKDMNEQEGKNIEYTFDDGTNYETQGRIYRVFTANSGKIYLSETAVDIYGYYPYSAKKKDGTTDLDPTAIEIDVSDQTSQEAIDLMRAKTANVTNGNAAIELLFKHKLVKLVFNLKQGDGLLPNELKEAKSLTMKILGQHYKATYYIYKEDNQNPFTVNSATTDIYPVRVATAPTGYVRTFEAIVLPNVEGNPSTNRTIEITFYQKEKDPVTNKFTIPVGTSFESGRKYVYNVTVNAVTVTVDTQKYTEQW